MLVDSHCHLDFDSFEADFDDVLARARSAGVGTMVTICTKLSEFERVRAIAEGQPDVWCSVGVHPHEAAEEGVDAAGGLIERAAHAKVVGIGETGLDYYYEHSPRAAQSTSFRAHIAAARETGLPLIVHTRDADDDTVDILRAEHARGAFAGVIHCFTAGRMLAEAALQLGFYISLSGIVTFKSARDLQETAKAVPLDRLLVETDAPYLAPVPKRGKRNEPAFVAHTAAFLAELRGETAERIAEITTDNFFALFAKARRPRAA
jgi:TatD DNase family protein